MTISARCAEALGAGLPPLQVAAERVGATVAQGVHAMPLETAVASQVASVVR